MNRSVVRSFVVAAGIATLVAAGGPHAEVTLPGALAWKDAGVPGVSIAAVDGDPAAGASHFFLRYAAGFVAPLHHHSADHFVTTVSGQLVVTVDGKEHAVPPGSFFALTGAAPHAARCEGTVDCVMSIDARAAWDVVLETPAP